MNRTILAVGVSVLLLSGCGTATVASSSTPPPLTLLPSADPYHSAVVATRAMGTAHAVIDVEYGAAADGRRLHAEGPVVLPTGLARLRWTGSDGSFEELVSDRGIFVTTDGTTWTSWSSDDPTATSGFADTFRGLDVLRDVTPVGSEHLAGVATTHYSGWLAVDRSEAIKLGLTEQATAQIGPDARELVDVWVDDFGHVIKVNRRLPAADGSPLVAVSESFDDFSLLLDLTVPTENVTNGTKAVRGTSTTPSQ